MVGVGDAGVASYSFHVVNFVGVSLGGARIAAVADCECVCVCVIVFGCVCLCLSDCIWLF